MEIEIIKLPGADKRGRPVMGEKCFRHYFETLNYSRKKFKNLLNIGPAVFNRSLALYYTQLDIETLRVKKIKTTTAMQRPIEWRIRAKIIEDLCPGIIDLVDNNEYLEALEKLVNLNDYIYNAKEALRLVLKHVRHGAQRRGLKVNLVANALEFKVKRILDGLGIDYICQFYIGNRSFDFKLVDYPILIEVDGRYHSELKDRVKDNLAIKNGYKVLRILEKEIKHVEYVKDKINNSLR